MVPGRRYTPRYLASVLRRRWPLVVVPLVLCLSAAAVLARALPDVYYTQAVVLIVPQQIPQSYVKSTVTIGIAERLRATSQEVKSAPNLSALIAEFGLYSNIRGTVPSDALIAWMARHIRIALVSADTFTVGYAGYDPSAVKQVTDRLVQMVIEGSVRERRTLAESASKFLDAELENTRRRLEEQERRVQSFRERYAGELPTQVPANLQILQGGHTQLQAVMEDLRRDRERRAQLQDLVTREQAAAKTEPVPEAPSDSESGEAPSPDGSSGPDPVAVAPSPASEQLAVARASLQQLLKRYTPEHPDVIRLQASIEALEKTAQKTASAVATRADGPDSEKTAAAVSPQLEAALAERARLDARIAEREALERRLRDGIATYQSKIEAVPSREAEWTGLTRDYQTLQQSYSALLAKKEEATHAANLERQSIGEQFRIIAAPAVPTRPTSPNRPGILLVGLLLGLCSGLGVPALLELTDSRLRGEKEVLATLRLPVLAMLPPITTAVDRKRRFARRLRVGVAVLIVLAAVAVWRVL